jgi:hypothetical protein
MSDREQYAPGPAGGAMVRKDGEQWTLILTRERRNPPEKVWSALTGPEHLRKGTVRAPAAHALLAPRKATSTGARRRTCLSGSPA